MTVIYAADVKTSRMEAVRDQIDAGSTFGKLEIGTSGMAATLATILMEDPASSVTGDVLTLLGVPLSVAASGTGAAAEARIRDSDDNDVVTGLTVGTGSEDIVLDSTSITSGQTVNITSGTITHAT
jgi:hypothetical protein